MTGLTLVGRDPATGEALRVTTSGETIDRIERLDEAGDPDSVWISPGLVDLQVNGFAGHDVNADDVTVDDIVAMVAALAAAGVTTVVPTVITAPEGKIERALSTIAAARHAHASVARAIPFAHVEGPFISPHDGPRGVHDRAFVRPADIDELARWQRACDGIVGVVTVSPHDDRTVEFVARAARNGVRCSIGHTHASPDDVRRAADAGATLCTHLGNGAHATLPRHPNYLWAQLADDRLHAGFIADGHHLSADTFKAMLRAKGVSRAHLVSDATAIAGLPPGRYTTHVGGGVELSADGRLSQRDTGRLAGAARSIADGVATAILAGEVSLATALRLATANPGRVVGGRGVLSPGAPADLVTFRWKRGDTRLDVDTVVTGGRRVTDECAQG